jgi:hypothetical protein
LQRTCEVKGIEKAEKNEPVLENVCEKNNVEYENGYGSDPPTPPPNQLLYLQTRPKPPSPPPPPPNPLTKLLHLRGRNSNPELLPNMDEAAELFDAAQVTESGLTSHQGTFVLAAVLGLTNSERRAILGTSMEDLVDGLKSLASKKRKEVEQCLSPESKRLCQSSPCDSN